VTSLQAPNLTEQHKPAEKTLQHFTELMNKTEFSTCMQISEHKIKATEVQNWTVLASAK
jgi:hypothetical protein